ncbi:MAG TPA: helix-turn-helix domain-containing protein [Vicinamibacterales bacterium]|nr:helix-turn-helix domain-containing protein [Vicinamibacterales bacterium]
MTLDEAIERVQFCYPQVYYACHTRHQHGRTRDGRLSPRDSQLLVHLDRRRPLAVTRLAYHMGLAASTVSEAISRLERFGYVTKAAVSGGDRRLVGILLTKKGVDAERSTSVLETGRLRTVVRRLSRRNLAEVIGGLTHLADACKKTSGVIS